MASTIITLEGDEAKLAIIRELDYVAERTKEVLKMGANTTESFYVDGDTVRSFENG